MKKHPRLSLRNSPPRRLSRGLGRVRAHPLREGQPTGPRCRLAGGGGGGGQPEITRGLVGRAAFRRRRVAVSFTEVIRRLSARRSPPSPLFARRPRPCSPRCTGGKPILKQKPDWTFTVWVPANWHRLYNSPKSLFDETSPNFRKPVAPPRLDVYAGGQVDWGKVKVPLDARCDERRRPAGLARVVGQASKRVL